MKPFQLCGLGNAIVDIFVEISDAEFATLGFERGGMVLVDLPAQQVLLDRYQKDEPRLASGGSVANSIIAFSQLGGQGAFIGCVGDDRYGLFYAREFEQLGIEFGNPVIVNEFTGTSVCLVTPDAERTMRTCLGVSSHLAARHVDEARIRDSEWLFIEGYVFANPETGQTAIQEALRVAKRHGTRIAITCSDAFVAQVFAAPLNSALEQAELLFCNETEACAITGASGAENAFNKLADIVPSAVVTNGPHGAYVRHGGIETHVPAFPSEPKDLTGAGDMFAGSFLYGITHGVPADRAARAAGFLSHKVISQVGARLHQGTRQFWDECLASL
ncbi:MAG: adenosine kinase [Acidobacteriota bacterium]